MSLITQICSFLWSDDFGQGFISAAIQINSFLSSIDLDSQPNKPKSKFMSRITQTISLFNSISDSEPDWELKSLITKMSSLVSSIELDWDPTQEPVPELKSLLIQAFSLISSSECDSEFASLLRKSLTASMKGNVQISLSPQLQVEFVQGKFRVTGTVQRKDDIEKGHCDRRFPMQFDFTREGVDTHFRCVDCNGEDHEEYEEAPREVKHPLHSKHSLQLVSLPLDSKYRECYCCDKDLKEVFYYCPACDIAMTVVCVEKPLLLTIDHRKWHKHALAHFPRQIQASLTCNLCALADSSSPIYMCPPCDFVVHLRCLNLPRVIRISRHLHRLSFTPSFDQRDWSCYVCRRKINNEYGGYSCVKYGCSYAAHSRCATQSNVWDGIDLEGEPEEIEEEIVEPFVRIGDGIIQHFSHQHHHLKLDDNTGRSYDEDKMCQACITPIYFGNFYSCMQCEFILHETCAYLSRKSYHPTHPHLLTLVTEHIGKREDFCSCSACPRSCTGFFYECDKEGCDFLLHVQCATIPEPLVHGSHMHPLFLTSKPEEVRKCFLCKDSLETFNCIECDDFALCFGCAVIPQKARYMHDKHILNLSYGEETSIMTYWCEACEFKISPKGRFYMCDENCCVTLHVECLIGKDLYVKPGSSWLGGKVSVMPNNHHMSRPICSFCKKRCRHKIVFQYSGSILCSRDCSTFFHLLQSRKRVAPM